MITYATHTFNHRAYKDDHTGVGRNQLLVRQERVWYHILPYRSSGGRLQRVLVHSAQTFNSTYFPFLMQTQLKTNEEWTTRKATWGPGPWTDEPDEAYWQDEATGRWCHAVRGPMGTWCGYVAVEPGHPLYERDMGDEVAALAPYTVAARLQGQDEVPPTMEATLQVHGGVTFSNRIPPVQDDGQPQFPEAMQQAGFDPEQTWWVGFDAAHAGDLMPLMLEYEWRRQATATVEEEYRTLEYVQEQCALLAGQLDAILDGD